MLLQRIGSDVRSAYKFIIKNYQENTKLSFFGFSRGAYAARILADLIYYAGIPQLSCDPYNSSIKSDDKRDYINTKCDRKLDNLVEDIYKQYKGNKSRKKRRELIVQTLEKHNIKYYKNINIDFIGLWDTVESLGLESVLKNLSPFTKLENVHLPNSRYGHRKIFHVCH